MQLLEHLCGFGPPIFVEHQLSERLGRILRKKEGKQAVLYELVVADSVEERTSRNRREHAAYQR